MKSIILAGLMLLSFNMEPSKLIGKWESRPSDKGNVTGVIFKADNSFDAYINRKPFTSGQYTFADGVFRFTDSGCEGKEGSYRIVFFSNDDSLRFEAIQDTCAERREGMLRLQLGRVK